MKHASEIQRIEIRQSEIEEKIAVLQKESDELTTTLRVIARFADGASAVRKPLASTVSPRPDGLPTTFEMVEAVLISAAESSGHGLNGREIVEAISERFWPGVATTQILPSVYRFRKSNRLRKTKAGRFSTVDKGHTAPKENEVPAGTSEANTGSVSGAPGVLSLHPRRSGQ